jgi:hypothetical protein
MAQYKATDLLDHSTKQCNISTDYVYCESANNLGKRIQTVSPMMIGMHPIHRCFIDDGNQHFPLRWMLNLGTTCFVISPYTAKGFKIPVVTRAKKVQSKDVTGREIVTGGLHTIPLG